MLRRQPRRQRPPRLRPSPQHRRPRPRPPSRARRPPSRRRRRRARPIPSSPAGRRSPRRAPLPRPPRRAAAMARRVARQPTRCPPRRGRVVALAIPGAGGAGAYGPYLAALRRRLQEALEYPAAARRRGLSGTVHLEIALEATGRVSEVMLVRSSSHALLDDAALDAARGLRRVPFPPEVRPRALRVRLPVVFELR